MYIAPSFSLFLCLSVARMHLGHALGNSARSNTRGTLCSRTILLSKSRQRRPRLVQAHLFSSAQKLIQCNLDSHTTALCGRKNTSAHALGVLFGPTLGAYARRTHSGHALKAPTRREALGAHTWPRLAGLCQDPDSDLARWPRASELAHSGLWGGHAGDHGGE